jgi:hypothetical protein
MEHSERRQINTLLDAEKPDVRSNTKLDMFLHYADIDDDVNQSPNSTSKSDINYVKAARDTAAALGNDRMLKLVNSGV